MNKYKLFLLFGLFINICFVWMGLAYDWHWIIIHINIITTIMSGYGLMGEYGK